MRRGARLAAVFVAGLAWSTVAVVLAEWSGLLAPQAALTATPTPNDDPCSLRQGLAVGIDARCEIPLARDGGGSLIVELSQTWESTAPAVLLQHMRVREADGGTLLEDVATRSTATSTPQRFQRVAVIPAGSTEHLVYVIGNCGGLGCGVNDVMVEAWHGRGAETVLRRRVGPLADIALDAGRVTVFDGLGGANAQRSPRMLRTFAWVGGVYAEVAREPVATAPPPASRISR